MEDAPPVKAIGLGGAVFEPEIECMLMQREDQLSLEYEKHIHRLKFAQKDAEPPEIPRVLANLSQNYGLLPKTPTPSPPLVDNYTRFRFNIKLPTKIDLKNTTVLWSKEKETAEQEAARKAELER